MSRPAAELTARVLDAEHEPVSQLTAEHRLRAGQHRHDPDLEVLRLRRPGRSVRATCAGTPIDLERINRESMPRAFR